MRDVLHGFGDERVEESRGGRVAVERLRQCERTIGEEQVQRVDVTMQRLRQ